MVGYKKLYLNFFGYGQQDWVPCESCGSEAVDIHHLVARSQGGLDIINNLAAVCRKCHDKAHGSKQFNAMLITIHLRKVEAWKNSTGK